jgi:rhodanese-related sulfurtransferase
MPIKNRVADTMSATHLKTFKFRKPNMKKIYSSLVFIFLVSGCAFQKPDYLKVITPAELSQIMKNEDVFLVDVHMPKQPHIKGTDLFVPYNEIEKHKDEFPKDKNTIIYLYCESGPMGNAAARSLYELGYHNLTNLEGGAKAWRKAGLDFE